MMMDQEGPPPLVLEGLDDNFEHLLSRPLDQYETCEELLRELQRTLRGRADALLLYQGVGRGWVDHVNRHRHDSSCSCSR